MENSKARVLQAFCDVTNRLKKSGYTPDSLSADTYLGGDMGIDSIEMLEIWYDLEQTLNVHIDDDSKRDIYTVGEAVDMVAAIVEEGCLV